MFSRLQLYTVHTKTEPSGEISDVLFVREGFNFWAFFFNMLWALYHRCWLLAALSFAIILTTELLGQYEWLSAASSSIIQIGGLIIIGMLANDELRESLEKRGYHLADMVSGENRARAQQRYFDRISGYAYL